MCIAQITTYYIFADNGDPGEKLYTHVVVGDSKNHSTCCGYEENAKR